MLDVYSIHIFCEKDLFIYVDTSMFKHLDIYICWIHQGCFGDHDSAHLDMAPYHFLPVNRNSSI